MAKPRESKPRASSPRASRPRASEPRAFSEIEPRSHEDAKLNKKQLKELFEKLLSERERLIKGIDRHLGEAVNDIDPLADEVDVAARHSEQAYLMRFADKERKLLREIDHALTKVRSGQYGICEGTEEPIGFPRLAIRPWTRYSIQHKEELEREKRERSF